MRGHVAKKGNKYYVVIYDKDLGINKWFSGYQTEQEALDDLPSKKRLVEQGGYLLSENPTVGDLVQRYFDVEIEPYRTKSTNNVYKTGIETIKKYRIWGLKAKRIKPIDIRNLINEMKKDGKTPSTIQKYLKPLKMALDQADVDGIIPSSPYKGIKIMVEKRKDNTVAWTASDIQKFFEYIQGNYDLYPAVMIALYTGMRISEICALEWTDLRDKTITVDKIIDRDNTVRRGTKTMQSRTVPVSSDLSKMFIEIKQMILKQEYPSTPYIIADQRGNRILPCNLRHKFDVAVKASSVTKITFHGLRDTFATTAIESGADVKTVSLILGHTSVKFTMDKYVKPSNDMREKAVESVQNMYGIRNSIRSGDKKTSTK